MNPLISVIIPVYKVEKYLDRCVESVVHQSYTNLEIILVDDGSPDNCPRMCDDWAKRDSRISVIHQSNKGLSAARNAGISMATGQFLLFVDSDDYIAQETLSCSADVIEQTGADVVVFNVNRVDESGNLLEVTEKIENRLLGKKEALRELFLGNIHDYAVNKVFKRELFENITFPVGRCFEDIGTTWKVFLMAKHVYTIDKAFYYYVKRKDGIIGSMSDRALEDLFALRKERYEGMTKIYPEIAELGFPNTAISALNLFDRSLWANTDRTIVEAACHFLEENREKVMEEVNDGRFRFYYRHPKAYVFVRVIKHRIGNLVKPMMGKG